MSAAFRAGTNPDESPTPKARTKARNINHKLTAGLQTLTIEIIMIIIIPAIAPIAQPQTEIIVASDRNCQRMFC